MSGHTGVPMGDTVTWYCCVCKEPTSHDLDRKFETMECVKCRVTVVMPMELYQKP